MVHGVRSLRRTLSCEGSVGVGARYSVRTSTFQESVLVNICAEELVGTTVSEGRLEVRAQTRRRQEEASLPHPLRPAAGIRERVRSQDRHGDAQGHSGHGLSHSPGGPEVFPARQREGLSRAGRTDPASLPEWQKTAKK